MKRDNVDGLVNVIRFAAAARVKALSLLSTISVYSWGHRITGKTVMREDDDLDQNLDAVCADIGYVKSKWVMEKLADAARARGLPLITFRVGYATYHAQTGLSADYQWWGRLVKTCIALRAVPELRELREGLSTVDYMTAAIAHIARNPAAPGKKFNLTHSGERNLSLEDFFDRLERAFGFSFARVPFRDWFDRWKDDAATPLYPVLNLFRDPMHGGMCMVELYQHTYRWEHANTSAFLAGSGVRPPEFDEPELRRYLVQSIGIAPACAARERASRAGRRARPHDAAMRLPSPRRRRAWPRERSPASAPARKPARAAAGLGARAFGAIIAAPPFADPPCAHPDSTNSTTSTATSSRCCRRTRARASRISRGSWASRARPCSRGSRGSSVRR
ncbi:SDR family oxidoreductase [Burkholderia pseudomallei]|uniref:SDR family oxidoreductase n=1 Tax=Burkholderia pseudomallei TaxID=28450 RepID=UPI000F1AFB89|nr:SDR family oxidoreductase [Burkholderia pseudomallei]VCK06724.1 linear gramicidin synthetase subunit D [Burkholderia pseudomallei]